MVPWGGHQGGAQRLFHPSGEDGLKEAGIVDLHTHGLGRVDTRTGDPRRILALARLHAEAGTGAFLPTLYPGPVREMRAQIEAVRGAMEMQKTEKTQAGEAHILGVHLEGPFLNPSTAGALDVSSFLSPTKRALRDLLAGHEEVVRIITIAPELPGALRVIGMCAELGIRVNMGHSQATYAQALEGKRAGATGVSHIFNAMRPFHHREPGLAGLGLLDEDLYVEVIADGVHLHPKTLEIIFGLKRLDRIILISDSVKGRKGKNGAVCRKGTLAGGAIVIREAAPVLRRAGVPNAGIIEASTDNPLRYLGLSRWLSQG